MWEGLSGGCRTGLTLESDTNWLSARLSRSVETPAMVWLVEDCVHPVRLFERQLVSLREKMALSCLVVESLVG